MARWSFCDPNFRLSHALPLQIRRIRAGEYQIWFFRAIPAPTTTITTMVRNIFTHVPGNEWECIGWFRIIVTITWSSESELRGELSFEILPNWTNTSIPTFLFLFDERGGGERVAVLGCSVPEGGGRPWGTHSSSLSFLVAGSLCGMNIFMFGGTRLLLCTR